LDEQEKREFESLEQEVFKALDHQMRRDILRYVGEGRECTFTDILTKVKVPDSPTLSYHLKTLAPFIEQQSGKYRLTPMGKDSYNLLLKAGTYNKLAVFLKKRLEVTFANALLWGTAIVAAAYLETNMILYTLTMPPLAFISIIITWQLFE
jgi:DNA-binding transcriptional ArsR family regulator